MYSLGRVTVVSGAQITVEADQPRSAPSAAGLALRSAVAMFYPRRLSHNLQDP